jgi:hypothetical protein
LDVLSVLTEEAAKVKTRLVLGGLALTIAFPCFAQQEKNALVWIDPGDQNASYLEAAVLRKHTPVTFTTDKSKAEYTATLSATEKKGSAARAIFLGAANSGARNTMSLTVSDIKTSNVVFSYTCQKNGEGTGIQGAAECLAKHWAHFIEKGKP